MPRPSGFSPKRGARDGGAAGAARRSGGPARSGADRDSGGRREWYPRDESPYRAARGRKGAPGEGDRAPRDGRASGGRDDRGDGRGASDRGGYERGGQDRGYGRGAQDRGYDRGAYDRGSNRGGYERGGDDRNGSNRTGYDRGASSRDGSERRGGDRGGWQGDRDRARSDRGGYDRDRGGAQRSERWASADRRPDRRPHWAREDSGLSRSERTQRAFDGGDDRRDERRDERAPRDERPSYRDRDRATPRDRDERPSYRDRDGGRDSRPSYRDRDDRGGRRFDDRGNRRGSDPSQSHERAPRERRDAAPSRPPFEAPVFDRLDATSTVTDADAAQQTFASLGLGAGIVEVLASLGAEHPFAIQAGTIPDVLAGRNVLARARTGSGKTIAFGAPLVERLLQTRGDGPRQLGRRPRALVLAPTRELALQIDRTIQPLARRVGLYTTQIVGGMPHARQTGALRRGVDIIVGTPGRIEDLVEHGSLDLGAIETTVLDEADHMCDLGFLEPVQRILRDTKPDGQRLLFSATLDQAVGQLVGEFLPDASIIEVAGDDEPDASTIEHRVLVVEQRDKVATIADLIRDELDRGEGKVLVFARTRNWTEELAERLEDEDIPAVTLHGNLSQAQRNRSLDRVARGRSRVLVATDVAARGLHVDDIDLVIQADPADESKTYLHRAGRTGRAGRAGTVVSLATPRTRRRIDDLLSGAGVTANTTDARSH